MGYLTSDNPKTLVAVGGKPILKHILYALKPLANEVIIVTDYLGHKIKKRFGSHFDGLKLIYVRQEKLAGTAGALWQVRGYLNTGKFLALNGDDIYSTSDLAKCLDEELAVGLTRNFPWKNYEAIKLNRSGFIKSWRKITSEKPKKKVLIISGAYVLDKRIFNYEPVKINNGEFGLPQTILKMSKEHPVKGVVMDKWLSINYPGDIVKAEKYLKN